MYPNACQLRIDVARMPNYLWATPSAAGPFCNVAVLQRIYFLNGWESDCMIRSNCATPTAMCKFAQTCPQFVVLWSKLAPQRCWKWIKKRPQIDS